MSRVSNSRSSRIHPHSHIGAFLNLLGPRRPTCARLPLHMDACSQVGSAMPRFVSRGWLRTDLSAPRLPCRASPVQVPKRIRSRGLKPLGGSWSALGGGGWPWGEPGGLTFLPQTPTPTQVRVTHMGPPTRPQGGVALRSRCPRVCLRPPFLGKVGSPACLQDVPAVPMLCG